MNNKAGTFLLFFGSVGLIVVAIVFTFLIDTKKSSTVRTDTRARASKAGAMNFTGTVSEYISDENILIVNNLKFADASGKSLGVFKVTPPASFVQANFPPGTNISISANASSFKVTDKTLIAGEIVKNSSADTN